MQLSPSFDQTQRASREAELPPNLPKFGGSSLACVFPEAVVVGVLLEEHSRRASSCCLSYPMLKHSHVFLLSILSALFRAQHVLQFMLPLLVFHRTVPEILQAFHLKHASLSVPSFVVPACLEHRKRGAVPVLKADSAIATLPHVVWLPKGMQGVASLS